MAKSLAVIVGAALFLATHAASAACSYEGQRYPTGAVLCIQGKLHICEANDAWKVDRRSSCSN